ncbi:MAG: hypothetical protein GTO30_17685, partial [Acidobacteria bacterium]|nr:hypothetical protein [Acidobacteriota bacterium]NIQ86273.1 hypothetical protein [Acidobacteriota bacterium]
EDRDADGNFDGGETDPQNPADDPACAVAAPTEIQGLDAAKSGADVNLSWIGQSSTDPCVLY